MLVYACKLMVQFFAGFLTEDEFGWIDVSSVWYIKMLVRKQTIDDDDDDGGCGGGGDDDDGDEMMTIWLRCILNSLNIRWMNASAFALLLKTKIFHPHS